MSTGAISPKKRSARKHDFDAHAFLQSAGAARKFIEYGKRQVIFTQGDHANSVFYIQKGAVKLTIVNNTGREAVVAVLGPGDFIGEGCLARHQSTRLSTATSVTPSRLLAIDKREMIRVLYAEHSFLDHFLSYIVSRNIRVEEDLVDQLFNPSEKRLARTLLLLARYGKKSEPKDLLPKMSQEMLAEMIGTTRSRVNFFMNKFRKHGFIRYNNGGIHINNSLLQVVLHE